MIAINDPKIKEILEISHQAMLRKTNHQKVKREKNEYVVENHLFSILCHDSNLSVEACVAAMNQRYGYDITEDEVIRIFRSRRIETPADRKELFAWVDKALQPFAEAISGNREKFDELETKRREFPPKAGRRVRSYERVAALMIYERYPELDVYKDKKSLILLGDTLAKYYFRDMIGAIRSVYRFPRYRNPSENPKEKESERTPKKQMTYEQAISRVQYLESSLERTNMMLQELQDEFDEQLQESKIREMTDFFSRLNSEKYGCILDELLVARAGMETLRKNHYELPIEINGLMIIIKKLIQFVRDSHIEPIKRIHTVIDATAADVEFCNYEGTPFLSPDEIKKVQVISPGWIYKDKGLQISRPRVKEKC